MESPGRLTTWLLLWMLVLPAVVVHAVVSSPYSFLGGEYMPVPPEGQELPSCDDPSVNRVYCENQLPGVGPDQWDLAEPGAGDPAIQGFATEISVNRGETIEFKIDSTTPDYRIEIYRLGYYQGLGARHMDTLQPTPGVAHEQPNCLTDPETGLIDCGNWRVSASWTVPPLAVSGVYLAKLVQTLTNASSHIVFIARDDTSGSDLLFQTSDTTWHAYNDYAGSSLYRGVPAGRAYKISYNRPLVTRGDPGAGRATALFNAEYPMIRWLEANGYDVSYTSGVDTDRRGGELLEHKVFLSVGHDEYWSGAQRANVEAARDAGVHLAFFSGNAVFWKTRWETSIDASGTPHRTLVCYKETHANARIDPSGVWTGTWRDPRFSPPADGGRPENALTGTLFRVNGTRGDAIKVPAAFAAHRFWRNTSVALLASGETATLPLGTLGYEWDEAPEDASHPVGLQRLSSTTLDVSPLYLQDYGNTYGDGTATHSLTLYRAASGALVFGAGTVQWSWGLDSHHDRGAEAPSPAMQQATVNLLADMGVHTSTLQPGLVSGADVADQSAPTSSITSPPAGAVLRSGEPVVISGTASDDRSLARVEVSVNGGSTWTQAVGLANWTFDWTPGASGPATLLSRAFDDSGNVQALASSIEVTVTRDCPCTIWDPGVVPPISANDDPNATEVGVRFRASTDGVITGVRFYKGLGNDGTHTGSLWTPQGDLLAQAVFTNETSTGWQQVTFASPVRVTADATYIASYHAPFGRYAVARPSASSPLAGFAESVNNPPLRALADGEAGGNGLFAYSASPAFPSESFGSTNYFVDVVFEPTTSADDGTPFVLERMPLNGAVDVTISTDVTARFSEALDAASVTDATVELRGPAGAVAAAVSYVPDTRTVVLDPTQPLDENTTYLVTLRGGPAGIRSLSGVFLGADVTWTFTTAAPVVCPCTIWRDTVVPSQVIDNVDDTAAMQEGIELGVRFRADHDGIITGIRFYKSEGNTGPHTGTLWTSTGAELATATLAGGTSSGWQEMTFASPVTIRADQTYVASYHAPAGRYSVDAGYFVAADSASFTRPPLRAMVGDEDGPNGVFRYGPRAFPTDSFNRSNYWVDVVFEPGVVNAAPVASADTYETRQGEALTVPAPGVLSNDTDAEGVALTADLVSTPAHGVLSFNNDGSFTYTPGAAFSGIDSFVYAASDGSANASATVTIQVIDVNHAPTASPQSVTTPEDTPAAIALAAQDADGDALVFTIVTPPTSGTLSGVDASRIYTPAPNFHGTDSFTFSASDGTLVSETVTVSVTVTPVNDPPVAAGQAVTTDEDTPTAITLAGSDVENAALTYTVVTAPAHGALSGTAPALTYTPAANYSGSDSFTYTVSDGAAESAIATVSIDIDAVNDAPVAAGQAVTTDEDTPTAITLAGSDVEGTSLTYTVIDGPTQGALSGTAPALTYTPAANYSGSDSFTYTVSDGAAESAIATVSVGINAVNDAPVAAGQAVATDEDTPTAVTLAGSDVEGTSLTYTVIDGPAHGALSGTAPALTYTPAANYSGSDSFTFTVSDGAAESAIATVSIDINAVNDAPVAAGEAVATDEDTPTAITLNGSDVEDAALTYTIVTAPVHGALSGTAPALTYTPAANYSGSDSFTFRVSDGAAESAVATVAIDINAVNDAPVAAGQAVTTDEDTPTAITLAGSDVENAALTYTIVTAPAHGALSGTAPALTYTPAANYSGSDSFTFRVSDGAAESAIATVSIAITAVNDAPVAAGQAVTTDEDTPTAITLNGSDVEDAALTYTIVTAPAHGALSGTAPALTYTPAANYSGSDSFTFRVSDGAAESAIATVSIAITAVNDAPVAAGQAVTTDEDTPTAITLNGSDVEDAALTYTIVTAPAHGALSGTAPALTYTPAANYSGSDSFTFRVSDGAAESAIATVSIDINAVNDVPVAAGQAVATDEDTPTAITLAGSDVEGTSLTYAVVDGPAHGALSGTAPALTYTPAPNYSGSDSFTFRVSDGAADSMVATVVLTVNSINDGPIAVADARSTVEDTPLTFAAAELTVNDTDPDGDTLTVTAVTGATTGTVVLAAGSITYTPAPNANGTDAFTYTVIDGNGGTASAAVNITITAANDAPTAAADTKTTAEDTPLTFAAAELTANDTDPDGDTLTVTAVTGATTGTVVLEAGAITYTPAPNANGSDTFTYTVIDGNGGTATGRVSVGIAEVNDDPALAAIGDRTVAEGAGLTIELAATDEDGDALTYAAGPLPAGSSLAGTTFTWTPGFDQSGDYTVTFTATDGTAEARETITIRVTDTNRAPVLTAIGGKTVNEGMELSFVIAAADADGDPVTFSASTLPEGAVFDGVTGAFAWVPQYVQAGSYDVTFTATDGTDSASETITIAVVNVNRAPVLATIGSRSVAVGAALTFAVSAEDPDPATTLAYTTSALPSGALFDAGSATFSWTPAADQEGLVQVTFSVSDGNLGDSETITIAVGADNAAADVSAGGTVSTLGDGLPGAGELHPVETSVTLPANVEGFVSIAEAPSTDVPPAGYAFLGHDVEITAPPATEAQPLVLTFLFDVSLVPVEADIAAIDIFRNDVAVDNCSATAGTSATPNPCIASRTRIEDGDVQIVVRTSHASRWRARRPTNRAPVASSQSVNAISGVATPVTVVATDPDGDALTFSLVDGPSHGAVSHAGGIFTYTASSGYSGDDSFTFKASDGKVDSNVATVTIAVLAATDTLLSSSAAGTSPTYGTAITLSAAVTVSGTSAAAAGGVVDFFDNDSLLGSDAVDAAGNATLTTTAIQAGTRTLTARYLGTSTFAGSTSNAVTQSIAKASATGTFATLSPLQKQYSDRVLMEATVSPATAAESVTFQIGTQVLATVPLVNGKASSQVQVMGAPGSRIVTAVFNSPNYTIANRSKSMSILREDARVGYTGSNGETLCLCGGATVPITVRVSDITAVDPTADPDAGDIGTATVSFVNRATLSTMAVVTVTPDIDRKTGTATYHFPASALGTASSTTITFGFVVNGNYTRNNAADNVTITIKK